MAFSDANEFIDKRVQKAHRKAMIDLDGFVVRSTPVATGRARSNWIPSINAPSYAASATESKSAPPQSASMIGRVKPYSISYLTNSVPYINKLNDGHSRQAPKNFVKLSIRRVARQFR